MFKQLIALLEQVLDEVEQRFFPQHHGHLPPHSLVGPQSHNPKLPHDHAQDMLSQAAHFHTQQAKKSSQQAMGSGKLEHHKQAAEHTAKALDFHLSGQQHAQKHGFQQHSDYHAKHIATLKNSLAHHEQQSGHRPSKGVYVR